MSIGKRLINTGAGGATPSCTTDTTDIFGDGNGIALYSLDYDASTAPDATTDYSGSPSNVEFGTDGHINWGAKFNGSSSVINIGSTATTPIDFSAQNWTISAWINPDVIASGNFYGIISKYGGSDAARSFNIGIQGSDSTIRLLERGSGANNIQNSTTTISTNVWTHIAVVRTSSTITFYVNGSADTPISSTFSAGNGGTENIRIGILTNTAYYFDGDIDQVRIFNTALDSTKVSTLANETACVYTGTTQSHLFGCIANYNFDGDAKEAMGVTAYDGTESNITYEFGRFGTAAVFNGTNGKISTPITSTNIGTSFTISCWVNVDAASDNFHVPIGNYSLSGGWYMAMFNNMKFNFYNSVGSIDFSTTATYEYGNWYHFCVVFTHNSDLKVFINGNKETNSQSVAAGTSTAGIQIGVIGTYSSSTLTEFDGKIDQVRIFNTALSDSNVEYLFNDEKQAYITKNASDPFGDSSEVAFYKMENNAADSTGSNTGTNYGATFTTTDALFGTYSASFDGSNDYIQTSLSLDADNASYSFWFKADSTGSRVPITFSNRDGVIDLYIYGTGSNSIGAGSGQNMLLYSTTALTEWNHVVVSATGWASSYSAGSPGSAITATIYLNGNLLGSLSPTPYGQTSKIRIGRSGGGYYYDGLIDQVRIFDRALEGDEVFKLYAEVIN
jgi:hypothetical protein